MPWRTMTLKRKLIAALRCVWIPLNNVYTIAPYLILMITLRPLVYVKPKWYWKLEGIFFNLLMAVVANWLWTCGHSIEEMGDDITTLYEDEAVLLVNHLDYGDTPVLMYALQHHPSASRSCLWIMFKLFKWTQFGLVSQVHGDFFIGMGKSTLIDLGKHLKGPYIERERKWLILFPEGTFLRKGKERNQKFAEKNGYPISEHVLIPRMGALQTILDTLNTEQDGNGKKGKPIKYLIDMTIGYPENVTLNPKNVMYDLLTPRVIKVLYRVYPVSQIPLESDKLQEWTYKMWHEKDKFLDEFYKTGDFPEIPNHQRATGVRKMERRHLTYNNFWLFSLQLLFIFLGYLEYQVFKYALSFIW